MNCLMGSKCRVDININILKITVALCINCTPNYIQGLYYSEYLSVMLLIVAHADSFAFIGVNSNWATHLKKSEQSTPLQY